jgi:hypothetical protein
LSDTRGMDVWCVVCGACNELDTWGQRGSCDACGVTSTTCVTTMRREWSGHQHVQGAACMDVSEFTHKSLSRLTRCQGTHGTGVKLELHECTSARQTIDGCMPPGVCMKVCVISHFISALLTWAMLVLRDRGQPWHARWRRCQGRPGAAAPSPATSHAPPSWVKTRAKKVQVSHCLSQFCYAFRDDVSLEKSG